MPSNDIPGGPSGPSGEEAQAVAAGCALLATADGADSDGLRDRLRALLRDDEPSAAVFDEHARHIRDDTTAGTADAMGVLRRIKGDVNAAKRVIEACVNAAGGGDRLSPAQVAMARSLCESLNLSPTQFGF
ncbi:TerB family tellurite resistance protein [Azospirillum sp. sgz302134]